VRIFRGHFVAAALALAVTSLGACAVVGATGIAGPPTPAQVTTLAGAVTLTASADRAATIYVSTAKMSRASLVKLYALRAGVHGTLGQLEDDQLHGRPLVFDAFKAALAAFEAFTKPT